MTGGVTANVALPPTLAYTPGVVCGVWGGGKGGVFSQFDQTFGRLGSSSFVETGKSIFVRNLWGEGTCVLCACGFLCTYGCSWGWGRRRGGRSRQPAASSRAAATRPPPSLPCLFSFSPFLPRLSPPSKLGMHPPCVFFSVPDSHGGKDSGWVGKDDSSGLTIGTKPSCQRPRRLAGCARCAPCCVTSPFSFPQVRSQNEPSTYRRPRKCHWCCGVCVLVHTSNLC